MTQKLYAMGDIHGHLHQLQNALSLIEADGGKDAEIVFLGDYPDRGPDTNGVVQTLLDGVNAGKNWTCLRGNHDRMFTRFVRGGDEHDDRIKSNKGWLHPALGGPMTLASYGVDADDENAATLAQNAVPEEHLNFLETRPLYHQTDDHIFVHAGIRPGIAMADQTEDDLIWIRNGFLEDTTDHGHLIVHGHTALEHPYHHGNRVNLDGGAGFGNPLIPAVFEGRDCWLLSDNGRIPLLPNA